MKSPHYQEFIDSMSTKAEALLNEIMVEYNFDLGHEFEIAICKLLEAFLPSRFGICRGFIVDEGGGRVGDDIIIYDRLHFPLIRPLNKDEQYAQKQQVPYEAVLAYIEAKNTLVLQGKGGGTFEKAVNQALAVKNLTRVPTFPPGLSGQTAQQEAIQRELQDWPPMMNPPYTAIISRNVRLNESEIGDEGQIQGTMMAQFDFLEKHGNSPDMIIAGFDRIVLPVVGNEYVSPFIIPGKSRLIGRQTPNKAFGIGLCNLLYALNHLHLGSINWPVVLSTAMNIGYLPAEES